MRNLFPILFIVLGCSSTGNNNLYPELSKINLRKYAGKEVSIFLSDINKQYHGYYFLDGPPNILRGGVFYFEEYYIKIIILRGDIPKKGFMANVELDDFVEEKIRYIEIITWSHGDDPGKIIMKSYRWRRNRG